STISARIACSSMSSLRRVQSSIGSVGTSVGKAGGSLPDDGGSQGVAGGSTHSLRRIGIVNVNGETAPTRLLTQIPPPVEFTNFRHKVSPNPVPSTFLSVVPTCRNSSNTAS